MGFGNWLIMCSLAIIVSWSISVEPDDCNWSRNYENIEQLLVDEEMQERLMLTAAKWEGKFAADQIGVNARHAVTQDYIIINYDSGMLRSVSKTTIVARNEALHFCMLAKALNGSEYATAFVKSSMSPNDNRSVADFVVDQLTRKIAVYVNFQQGYPGYGGFPPYLILNDSETIELSVNYKTVRSLEQGHLFWALIACIQALNETHNFDLARLYADYLKRMADNVLEFFYDPTRGQFWKEVDIQNKFETNPNASNRVPNGQSLLRQWFEEELFLHFAYLFGDWSRFGGEEARDRIWSLQRGYLRPIVYNGTGGPLVLEQGEYYSSFERIQYLYLPYTDVPINRALFINGEKARVDFSYTNGYPGLFSMTCNYNVPGVYDLCPQPGLGIQVFSYGKVFYQRCGDDNYSNHSLYDIITPGAVFPLLLLKEPLRPFGLAWYVSMLHGAKMQGPLGSTDSGNIDGSLIAPFQTWGIKSVPVLAFDGGVVQLVRNYLQLHGKYDDFTHLVNRERILAFENYTNLNSTDVPIRPPRQLVDIYATKPFTSCRDFTILTPKKANNIVLFALITGIVVLIIIILTLLCLHRRQTQKRQQYTRRIAHYHAYATNAKTPKDDEWEIDPINLVILDGEKLGSGAFASVYKGILKSEGRPKQAPLNRVTIGGSRKDGSGTIEVAVKMTHPHATPDQRQDFLGEIDFMKHLGAHIHLINMLGCISDPQNPVIILEFCGHGDLLKILRENKHAATEHAEANAISPTIPAIGNRSIVLQQKDLISIAWQICDAMVYLHSNSCIHRDLAARNVLIAGGLIAKIGDFGLCRRIHQAEYLSGGGLLPYRWLAPEALSTMEFSSKSDVWAYGVLLFEMFSFGEVPYALIDQPEMLHFLSSGQRLAKPEHATPEIYNLMGSCFAQQASERPSFEEIRSSLTVVMDGNSIAYGYIAATGHSELHEETGSAG